MEKYILKYKASLESPLMINHYKTGNFLESLDYIPGSSVRGAIAGHFIRTNKKDTDLFTETFGNSNTIFTNLYITHAKNSGYSEVKPVPMSVVACKRFNDYHGKSEYSNEAEVFHGIKDLAKILTWFNYLSRRGKGKSEYTISECFDCHCGEPREMETGYYSHSSKNRNAFMQMMASAGIDGNTGTSKEGILFSRSALQPGQKFSGAIIANSKKLLEEIKKEINGIVIAVGSYKSSGFGLVKIDVITSESFDIQEVDFQNDLNDFNDPSTISSTLSKCGFPTISIPDGERLFSISLLSDAILPDIYLRNLNTITAEYLGSAIGIEGLTIEKIYENSSSTVISGWNSGANFFKQDEVAIQKGSIFGFIAKFQNMKQQSEFARKMIDLAINGIGERKAEGFGRIDICKEVNIK